LNDLRPISSSRPHVWLIRWLLFFLISLGLGYAAVQRYDPRQTAGLSDTAVYYRMVAGEPVEARELRFRVLVPYVARFFYVVTRTLFEQPRSVYLALLISNAIFCATSACLIVAIGLQLKPSPANGMLGAALYLLNFAVMNLYLPAMVDAGEACALLAVTVTLLSRRWWLLVIWGALGTLAKETFVPLAAVFSVTWWYVENRRSPDRWLRVFPIAAMVLECVALFFVLRIIFAGAPQSIFAETHASGTGFGGRLNVFFSLTLWYVFIWLLPLGVLRLKKLPRPWVIASICAAITALALGMYRDIGGNVARPLFSVLGPMLSLSAATWLNDPFGSPDE
jgi:hypothetical protein